MWAGLTGGRAAGLLPGVSDGSEPRPDAVYRGLSQAELDAQYDQTTLVPEPGRYVARWEEASAAFRRSRPPAVLRHGPHEREAVDLFLPDGPTPPGGHPIHLHVHGGAWRSMGRGAVSHLGAPLVAAGVAYAAPGFPLAPEVPLEAMLASLAAALDAVVEAAPRLGLDAGALRLSGFSSGAHLAAALLAERPGAGWRGAVLASGIYDLEPVRLSARNLYLGLDEGAARRLSPIHRPAPDVPLTLLWGEGELDEFRRQGRAFAEALGGRSDAVEIPGANHFDVLDRLARPDGPLMAAPRPPHAITPPTEAPS